ncbi:UpxY family transcription antiterminator [Spirosoma arboris]|uniref:UpxY family transcription antiterminator n=1 Tax=Spirosoma arboris TaxID=2682092 RepID=UPI001D1121FC|nr:UpxY family transcription antiterminator [Spirosoma arboris]
MVIYTKSRSEKLAAKELQQRGVEVYCPFRKVKRKWSDRIKTVEEPLFRSYYFVHLEEHERQAVYEVPGVVG